MNVLDQAKPWVVASMLAATALFGQDSGKDKDKCRPHKSYEQSSEMAQAQMMPGYNAPARIDVRGSWDVYVTGSYIFWQPTQDGMEVGFSSDAAEATALSGTLIQAGDSYKSGFKVGLGMNFGNQRAGGI